MLIRFFPVSGRELADDTYSFPLQKNTAHRLLRLWDRSRYTKGIGGIIRREFKVIGV